MAIPIPEQGGSMSSISGGVLGLVFLLFFLQPGSAVLAQTQDLIVDICTTPNMYWNKQVFLKGHVVKVTPDPPGTNRGRFTLRDQSDKDIEVLTEDLPAQGKVYTVRGVVVQRTAGDYIPVINENSRALAEPNPANPTGATSEKPATTPPSTALPALAPSGKAMTKKEIDDAVRRELERRDEMAKQSQPPPVAQPAAAAVIPATPVAPGIMDNPLMLAGGAVLLVAIVAVLFVALRSKPAPTAYAPPAAAAPPYAAPSQMSAASAGQATQAGRGAATLVVSPATEVVARLGADLIISEGPDRGKTFSIGKPITTIGRSGARKNDLDLSDGSVSREQAKILYNQVDRSFTLVNESTTNPTRVNGNVVVSVPLANNDKIEFGKTILRFSKT
jgi:pSer/pThr/pTyr-binding forkhead associated (FHA) protein